MAGMIIRLCCIFVSCLLVISSTTLRSVKLDSINFQKLSDKLTALNAMRILSTIGILKISDVPNLSEAQHDIFRSLPSCLSQTYDDPHNTNDEIFETIMEDGTRRLSIGAKTENGKNNNFIDNCGKSSNKLQNIVDFSTRKLFEALDLSYSLSSGKSATNDHSNYIMKPYHNFTDLMKKGEHIEHLHSFYNTKTKGDELTNSFEQNLSMKMHTDLGLLIAMTTGYYSVSNTISDEKRGLFITLPSDEIVHFDENDLGTSDLIIMIGKGASDWLEPKSGVRMRAVPHALLVDLGNDLQATRSWYGKMFQPPLDAELSQKAGLTYENLRGSLIQTFTSNVGSDTNNLKISEKSGHLQTVQDSTNSFSLMAPTTCALPGSGTGIRCWMQCQATTGYSCSSNQYLTCTDGSGNEVSPEGMTDSLGCVSSTPATRAPLSSTQSSPTSKPIDGSPILSGTTSKPVVRLPTKKPVSFAPSLSHSPTQKVQASSQGSSGSSLTSAEIAGTTAAVVFCVLILIFVYFCLWKTVINYGKSEGPSQES